MNIIHKRNSKGGVKAAGELGRCQKKTGSYTREDRKGVNQRQFYREGGGGG